MFDHLSTLVIMLREMRLPRGRLENYVSHRSALCYAFLSSWSEFDRIEAAFDLLLSNI